MSEFRDERLAIDKLFEEETEMEKQEIMNTILEHDTKDLQETSDKIRKDIESKQ